MKISVKYIKSESKIDVRVLSSIERILDNALRVKHNYDLMIIGEFDHE